MSENFSFQNVVEIAEATKARIWPTGNVDSEIKIIDSIVEACRAGTKGIKDAINQIIGIEQNRGGDNH